MTSNFLWFEYFDIIFVTLFVSPFNEVFCIPFRGGFSFFLNGKEMFSPINDSKYVLFFKTFHDFRLSWCFYIKFINFEFVYIISYVCSYTKIIDLNVFSLFLSLFIKDFDTFELFHVNSKNFILIQGVASYCKKMSLWLLKRNYLCFKS